MESRSATIATTFPGKSGKGKIEFTRKPAIGAADSRPKDPPMSRQRRVFGTSRGANVPVEVPAHNPSLKLKTVPPARNRVSQPNCDNPTNGPSSEKTRAAEKCSSDKKVEMDRKTEKDGMELPEKTPRNPSEGDDIAVQQTPVTSSRGDRAKARVANLKPKTTSGSASNPKEGNIVVSQTPVASSPGSTVKRRVSNLNPKPSNGTHTPSAAAETSSLHPKPKKKSICLPGTSKMNPKEDEVAVQQTPASSSIQGQTSAAEKPFSDEKTGESHQKPKEKSVCLPREDDDVAVPPTPVVSYADTEKPSSDEKTSNLGLNPKKKKKSVCFQEKSPRLLRTDDAILPRTPVAPPPCGAVKPRRSGTPYHTAESCRGCTLDRLETSSYWLAQIKLAESAMKHFVSAEFFQLALESKAEPVRNLRVELRRYLARHSHLSEQPEWKDVSLRYGLVKDGGAGAECSVTRDIGLIKCSSKGDSREDIHGEPRERDAAIPPGECVQD